MPITLDDLTVNFSGFDQRTILEDWRWLIGDSRHPILISAIGNAYLQDENNGTIFALEPGPGEMRELAPSISEFKELLQDKEFVTDEFAVEVISFLFSQGAKLEPGEVFGFIKPPVFGGEYECENLVPTDLSVHFSILGRIHDQVRSLPPGTPIRNVTIS